MVAPSVSSIVSQSPAFRKRAEEFVWVGVAVLVSFPAFVTAQDLSTHIADQVPKVGGLNMLPAQSIRNIAKGVGDRHGVKLTAVRLHSQ